MKTIQPSSEYIFAKPMQKEQKTVSGIILTNKEEQERDFAEVINVGDKVQNFSSKDEIVYKTYAATEIKLNGEDYILINSSDVLGKILHCEDK